MHTRPRSPFSFLPFLLAVLAFQDAARGAVDIAHPSAGGTPSLAAAYLGVATGLGAGLAALALARRRRWAVHATAAWAVLWLAHSAAVAWAAAGVVAATGRLGTEWAVLVAAVLAAALLVPALTLHHVWRHRTALA